MKTIWHKIEGALPWVMFVCGFVSALANRYSAAAWSVAVGCFFMLDDGIKLHITIHQHDCPAALQPPREEEKR